MSSSGRYALIVAVDEYEDNRLRALRAPSADAVGLAAVLGDPEIGAFDVQVALNERDSDLRRRLSRFLKDRRPDDLLLLHFSCHGVKADGGRLYLATTDTDEDLLGATAIDAEWLDEQIHECASKRVVVLLDCCYSGAFRLGVRARGGTRVHLADHFSGQGRGRIVITASSATEAAFEDDEGPDGRPSYFTEAVIHALRTGEANANDDGWVSVEELYEYVRTRVAGRTPRMTPNKIGHVDGDLFIARTAYRPPAPRQRAPAPAGDRQARRIAVVEHAATITGVAFWPGKDRLVTGGLDKEVRIWDLPEGRLVETLRFTFLAMRQVEVTGLAVSPDGRFVAAGSKKGYTRIWEHPPRGKQPVVANGDFGKSRVIRALAFSHDGHFLATASANHSVRIWDLWRRKRVAALGYPACPTGVALGRGADHLAVAFGEAVKVVTVPGNRVVAERQSDAPVRAIALSRDCRWFASASSRLEVWDLPGGRLRDLERSERTLIDADGVRALAFSHDGTRLLTAGPGTAARIWRLPEGDALSAIEHESDVDGIAFSSDGRYVATTAGGRTAFVWELG